MILTVEASSVREMATKLSELSSLFNQDQDLPQEPIALKEPEIDAEELPPAEEKQSKKTRAKKQEVQSAPPSASKAATKAQVLAALQDVSTKKGLPVAKIILADFSCSRISELKESEYAEFIEACTEAVA